MQPPPSGPIADHPLRAALLAELHARPSPAIEAPAQAHFIALRPERRSRRDHAAERRHLMALLDGHDVPGPAPDATHWAGQVGSWLCKWESHTELVTYLFWRPTSDAAHLGQSPAIAAAWLAAAPGLRLAAATFMIERLGAGEPIPERVMEWFDGDSLAMSRILDGQLVIAGDFLPDQTGAMRFAVLAQDGTGTRRIGRTVQRLCEIETYRALAMLGFARARELSPELGRLEGDLASIAREMGSAAVQPAATLNTLLDIGGEVEQLITRSSFRFAATAAYNHLVEQRIGFLREAQLEGRQTFSEFMRRRFDPAMRTVAATERRVKALSEGVLRVGQLLRTRVDVEHSEQNRALLRSMDRRSDLALKLQHTVEGLSVVAISYYAVTLALYLVAPWVERIGVEKSWAAAALVPAVVALVWLGLRRARHRLH